MTFLLVLGKQVQVNTGGKSLLNSVSDCMAQASAEWLPAHRTEGPSQCSVWFNQARGSLIKSISAQGSSLTLRNRNPSCCSPLAVTSECHQLQRLNSTRNLNNGSPGLYGHLSPSSNSTTLCHLVLPPLYLKE